MIMRLLLVCVFITFSCTGSIGQINLQTGAAEINFPLYSYDDANNRIGTSVSLAYASGNGLKVSQTAGCVGTGWMLNCGGVIERIQNGEPDDQKQYLSFSYPSGPYIYNSAELSNYWDYRDSYYPNGFLYSEYDPGTLVDNGAGYMPLFGQFDNLRFNYKQHPKYLADREQDRFAFNINGRTGEFVIGRNWQARTLYDSRLKIELVNSDMRSSNVITTISEIRITDEYGVMYVFKELELSEVIKYDLIHAYQGTQTNPSIYSNGMTPTCPNTQNCGQDNWYLSCRWVKLGSPTNKFVASKWYLSEIVNPATNKKIQFQYESFNFDMNTDKVASKTVAGGETRNSLLLLRTKGISKRIVSISCSPKEQVSFIYSSDNRKDLTFDKYLKEIHVLYNSEIKRKWEFGFQYFCKTVLKSVNESYTAEELKWVRLCLKSLKKSGPAGESEPPTVFQYYIPDPVNGFDGDNVFIPPMYSHLQDHWGYYNAHVQARDAWWGQDPGYITNTRDIACGFWYMDVSNPTYYKKPKTKQAQFGIIKSVKYPAGGSLSFEYEQNTSLNSSAQEVLTGGVRVKKTTLHDNIDPSKDVITEYKYLAESGGTSGWGYETGVYTSSFTSRVYKCGNNQEYAPNVIGNAVSYALNSGLTLTSMFNGPQMKTNPVVSFASNIFIAVFINAIWETLIGLFQPNYTDFTISTTNAYSSIGHNKLPCMYSRVEAVNLFSVDNVGKTVFYFTSPADYPIDVPTLSQPYSGKQRLALWAYGRTKKIMVYDKNNKLLKLVENEYNPNTVKYQLISNDHKSQKWMTNHYEYNCMFVPTPYYTTSTSNISSDIYYPICGRMELTKTKEHTYNTTNTDYSLAVTDYEYNATNFLLKKVKKLNAKGELIESFTYYPEDYSMGGAIQSLKNYNMIAVPVSTQLLITKSSGQKYLLDGSVSEFGILLNGDIKAIRSYEFRNDIPILSSNAPFNGAQLIPNTTYYKETGAMSYDVNGNLVQIITEHGKKSTIFDYENKLAVASVANAGADDIAYTSFETESLGGWTMIPGSTIVTERGLTGKRSFSGSLSKALAHPGDYTVTIWSNTAGFVTVNSQNGTLLATNGIWHLYEWKLTNVSNIQVAGTNVDEVRLYPANARMTTTTYDPVFGLTSECDAASRVTYYDYDDLGRLRIVRDEKGNVLRTYEYNFKL